MVPPGWGGLIPQALVLVCKPAQVLECPSVSRKPELHSAGSVLFQAWGGPGAAPDPTISGHVHGGWPVLQALWLSHLWGHLLSFILAPAGPSHPL